jgi:hypothetical protein
LHDAVFGEFSTDLCTWIGHHSDFRLHRTSVGLRIAQENLESLRCLGRAHTLLSLDGAALLGHDIPSYLARGVLVQVQNPWSVKF